MGAEGRLQHIVDEERIVNGWVFDVDKRALWPALSQRGLMGLINQFGDELAIGDTVLHIGTNHVGKIKAFFGRPPKTLRARSVFCGLESLMLMKYRQLILALHLSKNRGTNLALQGCPRRPLSLTNATLPVAPARFFPSRRRDFVSGSDSRSLSLDVLSRHLMTGRRRITGSR